MAAQPAAGYRAAAAACVKAYIYPSFESGLDMSAIHFTPLPPSAPRRRSAAGAGATLCARFGRHCGDGSLSASNIPPPVRRRGGHYQISFVIKANRLLCDIRPRTCRYELRRKYLRGAECGVNKLNIDATGGNKKMGALAAPCVGLGEPLT